jgi:4-oxalomesaconate tautomerase
MLRAIPCTVMRGGTSKGLYFLASDLPNQPDARARVLLAAMGSPDPRQIDGMGGAHPLTSKVAVVAKSDRADADVDYLFLQVSPDKPEVSDSQPCGNILAGIGPFAVEKGLVKAGATFTDVRIFMVNTKAIAVARVETPGGVVNYEGAARIDGVPGTAAPVMTDFLDVAGSSCGALLPTGRAHDTFEGIEVTCVDNGMPVVVLRAADLGKTGYETPIDLEADPALKAKVEAIRLAAGRAMNLGDVSKKTVPKMTLIAPPREGGAVSTRTFIPHRVHEAIGVLGAVSVATACVLKGSVADGIARIGDFAGTGAVQLDVEHPTGFFTVDMEVETTATGLKVSRSALLRTARKLMEGHIFVPSAAWSGA